MEHDGPRVAAPPPASPQLSVSQDQIHMTTPTSSSAPRTEHGSRKKLQWVTVTETGRKGVQPSQNYAIQWQKKFKIISWNMVITLQSGKNTAKYVQKYSFWLLFRKVLYKLSYHFVFDTFQVKRHRC